MTAKPQHLAVCTQLLSGTMLQQEGLDLRQSTTGRSCLVTCHCWLPQTDVPVNLSSIWGFANPGSTCWPAACRGPQTPPGSQALGAPSHCPQTRDPVDTYVPTEATSSCLAEFPGRHRRAAPLEQQERRHLLYSHVLLPPPRTLCLTPAKVPEK